MAEQSEDRGREKPPTGEEDKDEGSSDEQEQQSSQGKKKLSGVHPESEMSEEDQKLHEESTVDSQKTPTFGNISDSRASQGAYTRQEENGQDDPGTATESALSAARQNDSSPNIEASSNQPMHTNEKTDLGMTETLNSEERGIPTSEARPENLGSSDPTPVHPDSHGSARPKQPPQSQGSSAHPSTAAAGSNQGEEMPEIPKDSNILNLPERPAGPSKAEQQTYAKQSKSKRGPGRGRGNNTRQARRSDGYEPSDSSEAEQQTSIRERKSRCGRSRDQGRGRGKIVEEAGNQQEPQPPLDTHAQATFHDSRGDEESGTNQQRDTMGETAHPGEESPSSQEVPQSKEAGDGDSGKSAENLRSPDSKMAGDQPPEASRDQQTSQFDPDALFIGNEATHKNWKRDRAAESGDRSEPDGDEKVPEDKNGVRATTAAVPQLQNVKAAINHEMQNQGKSKIPDGAGHGACKSSDDTQDSDPQVTAPPSDNLTEPAGSCNPLTSSESSGPQAALRQRPPSCRENSNVLGSERQRNSGTTAGMQDNKNISNENLFETRTIFKKRVADQGWDCSESLDSLLQRLKDHKKEQRFYRLGVQTRDVSHHASYGGLYEALKEVDQQEVEAIRTQKHGNVHDSAAKYFIDDLAQSEFRVGHLVVYFCDDHHRRADIVRFVAEFHRDCPTCTPLF